MKVGISETISKFSRFDLLCFAKIFMNLFIAPSNTQFSVLYRYHIFLWLHICKNVGFIDLTN